MYFLSRSTAIINEQICICCSRIWYVNEENHFISPVINPAVLEKLASTKLIVYGMGSIWTSIMPCLLLAGTGAAIAAHPGRKVFLLNSVPDRESGDMDATSIIQSMVRVISTNETVPKGEAGYPLLSLITDILIPRATQINVDYAQLSDLGLAVEVINSDENGHFEENALVEALTARCVPPSQPTP